MANRIVVMPVTKAIHDEWDHTPVADSINLADLKTKPHTALTNILSDQHHVKTGHDEVRGLLAQGLEADRPAVAVEGRLYYATDTGILWRDTGTVWEEKARAETKIRLASLSERDHASLTGILASQHHAKTSSAAEITSGIFDAARIPILGSTHVRMNLREGTNITGTWVVENDILTEKTQATSEIVLFKSIQSVGAWELDVKYDLGQLGVSANHPEMFFMWLDASNFMSYSIESNTGNRLWLDKIVGGTGTNLITGSHTADTAWHTAKVTRAANGAFEILLDGISRGTGVDTAITKSNEFRFRRNTTSGYGYNMWVKNLRVT